jgi:pimeloyl-ACP methyl ester carboxylesterase
VRRDEDAADMETPSTETIHTPSGVRLRLRARRPGRPSWLFLPGGPGIGAESLFELIDAVRLPGTSWAVDLPGDGSNVAPPGAGADPYERWPQVLLEAAHAVEHPVLVGHSTGGMYLLSTPALEEVAEGLALVSTAPDATWLPVFERMTEHHPLPAVAAAGERYEAAPSDDGLRDIAVASAAWNFTPEGLAAGAELLARMPYNRAAVDWSARHFDATYEAAWWPGRIPTLIVSGAEDRIVTQRLWEDPRFHGPNVIHREIDGGAHFPWIERPDAVRAAFGALSAALNGGAER